MTGKTSAKASLRLEIKALLARLPNNQKDNESKAIRKQLTFSKGSRVALFAGTQNEPQLLDLISQHPGILWHLPRVTGPTQMEFIRVIHPLSLTKGAFGILEPTGTEPATDLDAIICPGLAFTPQGSRLGQGGGFYDRALLSYPTARRIGVTFSCQLVPQLPQEKHDLSMQSVITGHPES